MQGYLKQKNGFFAGYTPYFFLLHDEKLIKYKTNKDNVSLETLNICLTKVSAIIEGDSMTGKKNTIAIFIKGKSPLFLYAASQKDCVAWISALQTTLAGHNEEQIDDIHVLRTMESVLDPCVVADKNCEIHGWNHAAEVLFGYKKEEVVGQSVKMLMPSNYAAAHDEYVRSYHESGNKVWLSLIHI